MHRSSALGYYKTLISVRLQEIDGKKYLAENHLDVSTPAGISKTKYSSTKAEALPETSVSQGHRIIRISEDPYKKPPENYRL